jgi:hypothetical protein
MFPDPRFELETLEHLVGDNLFVVPPATVEPGIVHWTFPRGSSWVSSDFTTRFDGGSRGEAEYPMGEPLYFYRSGAVLPVNFEGEKLADGYYDALRLFVVPLGTGDTSVSNTVYEDDGLAPLTETSYCEYELLQKWEGEWIGCHLRVRRFSKDAPRPRAIEFRLPQGFSLVEQSGTKRAHKEALRVSVGAADEEHHFYIVKSDP